MKTILDRSSKAYLHIIAGQFSSQACKTAPTTHHYLGMPTKEVVKRIVSAQATDQSKTLGVIFNGKAITPGQYIPRAGKFLRLFRLRPQEIYSLTIPPIFPAAQNPPSISYTVPNPSSTYIIVCLDLDAPFPSFSVLGPVLHWIQPGFRAGTENTLTSNEPFIADYAGPAPPPGSSPHRYTFLLFEQPDGFEGRKYAPAGGKTVGVWGRMRYDLDAWVERAGLGDAVAGNWFLSS